MLQTLLDERFHLAFHYEPRRRPHYALIVANNGPKLTAPDPDPNAMARQSYGRGKTFHSRITMDVLAMLLSRQLRQAVLDETRIRGLYDVKLEYTPDAPPPVDAREGAEPPTGPSIFTAVQEQLGLKLEPRKDNLDVMVIDRADKVPVSN